jgi:hypothetical protein
MAAARPCTRIEIPKTCEAGMPFSESHPLWILLYFSQLSVSDVNAREQREDRR